MAYDWTGAEKGQGGPQSEPGWHLYAVTDAIRGTRDRTFESKKGDPQLLVIFHDEDGGEATTMFTLSEKAAWTLARFLSRAGFDLDALTAEGVEPKDWADEDFAKERLRNKRVYAYCSHEKVGDRTFTKLAFEHRDKVPGEHVKRLGERPDMPDEEPDGDIPFLLWLPLLLPLLRMVGGVVV